VLRSVCNKLYSFSLPFAMKSAVAERTVRVAAKTWKLEGYLKPTLLGWIPTNSKFAIK